VQVAALHHHPGTDPGDPAGGVEDLARSEIPSRQQQRRARELFDVDRPPPPSAAGSPDRQDADRKQRAALEVRSADHAGHGEVKRAFLDQLQQAHAAFLREPDLDPRLEPAVASQEGRQQALRELRSRPHAQQPDPASPERARPVLNRHRLRQGFAAAPQQVLAVSGELDVTADAVEERQLELRLEITDLARERRLAHVQTRGGLRNAQLFRHRHEVPEMPELHPDDPCLQSIDSSLS
jgi:hypothetical protein